MRHERGGGMNFWNAQGNKVVERGWPQEGLVPV